MASETLAGVRVVKGFLGEDYESPPLSRPVLQVLRARVGVVTLRSLCYATVDLGVLLGTIIVVQRRRPEGRGGHVLGGRLVAYLGYLGKLYGPAKRLSKVNVSIQKTLAAADRIFEVMDLPPEETARVAAAPVLRRGLPAGVSPQSAPGVLFEQVTFSYGGGRPALKDFTLDVAPGEAVALVGRERSRQDHRGQPAPRFYAPDSGRILLDGVRSTRSPGELRGQIGLVSQDRVPLLGDDPGQHRVRPAHGHGRGRRRGRAARQRPRSSPRYPRLRVLGGGARVQASGGQRQRIAISPGLAPAPAPPDPRRGHLAPGLRSEHYVQEAFDRMAQGRPYS